MTDDQTIDRRLRAALRHAPDGDLAPPPSLDRSILAAARLAVGRSAVPPPRRIWRRWFDSLLQPPAAAALATVVLGTVIGVLWHGDVPPEAMPASLPAAPTVSAIPAPAAVPIARLADDARPPFQPAPPSPPAPPTERAPASSQTEAMKKTAPPVKPTAPAAAALGQEPAPRDAAARDGADSQAQAGSGLTDRPAASNDTPAAVPAAVAAVAPPLAMPSSSSLGAAALAENPAAASRRAAGGASALARFERAAPARAAAAQPEAPPFVELLHAAASPWQRLPADRMPAGGTLLHDSSGQAVIGRLVIERDVLWWQPWAGGQAAQHALRAATSAADAQALQQRWPSRMGLNPDK